ncbi:MAG: hypothetical protein ACMZI0_04440 [Symbiopectobacterium sp.]|uniref:hypothetical protein n=1 Tax=Symbiopectobacterium sp. TaxID=2952789 RepID=UPI0039EC9C68
MKTPVCSDDTSLRRMLLLAALAIDPSGCLNPFHHFAFLVFGYRAGAHGGAAVSLTDTAFSGGGVAGRRIVNAVVLLMLLVCVLLRMVLS